jgi:hypothetical protein
MIDGVESGGMLDSGVWAHNADGCNAKTAMESVFKDGGEKGENGRIDRRMLLLRHPGTHPAG